MTGTGAPEERPQQGGGRRRRRIGVALVVVALVAALIALGRPNRPTSGTGTAAAAAAPAHPDASIAGLPVVVGSDVCGAGWIGGRAGRQTFALWDDSSVGVEVYLQNVDTGKVSFDAEGIGVDVTRSFSAVIGPGHYRLYCLPSDGDGLPGPTVTVTGASPGATTPAMAPVTDADLLGPIARYHAWVTARFPRLLRQVRALAASLRRADPAAAKRDWLAAHRTYATMGAAYDAFGEDGDPIDARPAAGTDPAKDSDLQGFHKIEALLWGGVEPARIVPAAEHLVAAVATLRTRFKGERLNTIDIGLRSHEILEDAIQFVLNGDDDAGSGTALATLDANLTGTLAAMRPIRPLLRTRDTELAETDRWIHRSQRIVRSYRQHDTWTPLTALTTRQREELNGAISQTAELLSRVATIAEPRGAVRQ